MDLLEYADNVVKEIEAVKFVYDDTHGNLKMMFNEPVNSKSVYAFNSKIELAERIIYSKHQATGSYSFFLIQIFIFYLRLLLFSLISFLSFSVLSAFDSSYGYMTMPP